MSRPPRTGQSLEGDVGEHGVHIDELRRKNDPQPARAFHNLDEFPDVVVPYKHEDPEKRPKDGQIFRWVKDDTVKTYKGYFVAGAKVTKGYDFDLGVGDLSVSIDLTDGDWGPLRACHVDATMLIGPAFDSVLVPGDFTAAVTIDGDPHDLVFPEALGLQGWVPSPLATIQILDAGAGPGTPSDLTEVATRSWSVADPHSIGGAFGGSISWTFVGGTPHIEANVSGVDEDAWPDTHTIYVVWRLTYL